MPQITKLERQKHNQNRISVFVDGQYAFSISDELAVLYRLAPEVQLENALLAQMMQEDEYKRALSAAFAHMSHSEKSEKQMRNFLEKKEFSPAAIEQAVIRLQELGYLDDAALAENFIAGSKTLGRRAIEYKLREKGLARETIQEALEALDEDTQLAAAKALVAKQAQKYAGLEEKIRRRKLSEFLARRGFDWDTITEALGETTEDWEETE